MAEKNSPVDFDNGAPPEKKELEPVQPEACPKRSED